MHSLLSLTDSAPHEGRPRPSRCIDPGQREFSAGRCTRSGGRPGGSGRRGAPPDEADSPRIQDGEPTKVEASPDAGVGPTRRRPRISVTPCAIEANPPGKVEASEAGHPPPASRTLPLQRLAPCQRQVTPLPSGFNDMRAPACQFSEIDGVRAGRSGAVSSPGWG